MRAREQINPVREHQDDRGDAHKHSFRRSNLDDAHSRCANHQDGESVSVEDRQSAQEKKHERVPFPRAPQIEMEKSDGRASRAASDAWMSGDRQESAVRPGQSKRKPGGSERERAKRHAQPNELVIEFIRRERATRQLHRHRSLIGVHEGAKSSEHHNTEEPATAADDHRKQHRQHSTAGIGLMRASQADATKDNVPYSCDQTAT